MKWATSYAIDEKVYQSQVVNELNSLSRSLPFSKLIQANKTFNFLVSATNEGTSKWKPQFIYLIAIAMRTEHFVISQT